MFKQLRNNFTQAFGGTLVWILILVTLFVKPQTVALLQVWSMVAIAAMMALVFGVIYTYLWKYSTNKASTNIVISSALNVVTGLLSVYLFSREMFDWILPYAVYIAIATVLGHVLGFYFYAKAERRKSAGQLNELLENSKA